MYTNDHRYHNLVPNVLHRNMKMAKYTEYCQVELLEEGEYEVKIALAIRTENEVLREFTACNKLNDRYIEPLDLKCYLEGRDPSKFINNYPNMISKIADHLVTRYKMSKLSIVRHTMLEPLGVLKINNTIYLPFELFVSSKELVNLPTDTWENIKDLQSDFTNNNILDTILIEKLKTV